jgi:hypothetical protein
MANDTESLAGIFLPIAAFISQGSLKSYKEYQNDAPDYNLRMIAYLRRICGESPVPESRSFASVLCEIVFLPLEPDKKVITMNQLVDFVVSQERYGAIVSDSCDTCRREWINEDRNTAATFAVFKDTEVLGRNVGFWKRTWIPKIF